MYALFASVFTIEKTALEYSQPLFLLGARMSFAGFLMLGYQYLTHPQGIKIRKKHLWGFVGSAVFSIYITNTFELLSMESMSSYKTCFIYALSPFISALFSYLFFSEGLSSKKWMGLAIGFFGFVPLLIEKSSEEQLGSASFLSLPVMMMFIAVICSVYGWIQLRQLVRDCGYSPYLVNGFSMLLGGLIALTNSWFVEDWNPIPVKQVYPFLECSLLLLLISNFLCYNMYGALLKKFSATFLAFAGNTIPMFAALFGWLFLGEGVTGAFFLSSVIVSLGLFLFFQEELEVESVPYYIFNRFRYKRGISSIR